MFEHFLILESNKNIIDIINEIRLQTDSYKRFLNIKRKSYHAYYFYIIHDWAKKDEIRNRRGFELLLKYLRNSPQ